ncbi:MAG: hypothetical protein JSS09_09765, partial [Verrucomicrobia bacterium]|nr:hypothetical protein [Verrucomicrobiota bacterium]
MHIFEINIQIENALKESGVFLEPQGFEGDLQRMQNLFTLVRERIATSQDIRIITKFNNLLHHIEPDSTYVAVFRKTMEAVQGKLESLSS